MSRSWPLVCLMQTSLSYIYSGNYLLGFNLLEEAVVVVGKTEERWAKEQR